MQVKKLTRVKDIVAENISSLYKTAIAEIARKDAQCKELQSRVILLQAGGRATR